MNLEFQLLSEQLRDVAQDAALCLRDERGLGTFHVEKAIDDRVEYCPTLRASGSGHYIYCIEVIERYTSSLDSFILDCITYGIPVKLFLALPRDVRSDDYRVISQNIQKRFLGKMEYEGSRCIVVKEALALTVGHIRVPDLSRIPKRYKEAVKLARSTYEAGDPEKGCLRLYELIEDIGRRMATRLVDNGWWKSPKVPSSKYLEAGSWSKVMEDMEKYIVRNQSTQVLSPGLLSRIRGVTGFRNDVGHIPRSRRMRTDRDSQIKTRFESAMDILIELVQVEKKLK